MAATTQAEAIEAVKQAVKRRLVLRAQLARMRAVVASATGKPAGEPRPAPAEDLTTIDPATPAN